jgi:hypothetical protein
MLDQMTIHYHGTPITPNRVLHTLAGGHFCVSFMRPDQVEWCDKHGQSLMIDNGAFTAWKSGKALDQSHWQGYYDFCDIWLNRPTTWCVIPDVIDAGTQEQDALLREWPFGQRGAPVWHMDEPVSRLLRLIDDWSRVCIGSTAEFAAVGSPAWDRRMDDAWNEISRTNTRTPNIHMLRGMQTVKWRWPFASVDSTDVARNHNRVGDALKMMRAWDARNCPAQFVSVPQQMELLS